MKAMLGMRAMSPGQVLVLWSLAGFLLARAGAFLGTWLQTDGAAVMWPASGVAAGLAAVTRGQNRWAAMAGVAASVLAGGLLQERPASATLLLVGLAVLEAVAIAAVLRQFLGTPIRLDRFKNAACFIAITLTLCGAVGLVAALGLRAIGLVANSFAELWYIWFSAHALGVLAFMPVFLLVQPGRDWSAQGLVEDVALASAVATATLVVFGGGCAGNGRGRRVGRSDVRASPLVGCAPGE
jgi:integral membrane sensor domain MASE1